MAKDKDTRGTGRPHLIILLLSLLAGWPVTTIASPVLLGPSQPATELGSHMHWLIDPRGKLNAQQALAATDWQPPSGKTINHGIDQRHWWFRVDLRNPADSDIEQFLLEIAYASLDHADIYLFDQQRLVQRQLLGDQLPFDARPIEHHFFVTPMTLPAGSDRTLLIHVHTNGVVQLPLTLWQPDAFASHNQHQQLIFGIYFGSMLVMLIYNLFMYLGIGDRTYLYYVFFVASVPLFVASLTGYAYQYLWPEAIDWNGKSIGFSLSIMVLFAVLFTHRFLDLDGADNPGFIRHGNKLIMLLAGAMLATVFLLSYNSMLITVMAGSVIACSAALFIGLYGSLHGQRPAIFYLLAWGSLFFSGLILSSSKLALLPQNVFTDNAVQFGSMLLVVLLSFALAERINDERRRRYQAQLAALQHERRARLAQEQALNAQQEANRQLEAKVAERTEELAAANAVLQELSDSDALTGLRNRRFLDTTLTQEYTRCFRYQHSLSLILLDIDHFKQFNDSHGHQVGDDCLRMVARLIQQAVVRESDVVARYGGEEFCVVLPETELPGALAVAERIRQRIAGSPFQVAGSDITVTVSLGVSCTVPLAAGGEQQLLNQADQALYEAKAAGRNRVHHYQEENAAK